MLILTRKPGESLYIGDDIKITIVEIKGHQIRVGIDAPKDLRIYREEIYLQIMEENKSAAQAPMEAEKGLESLTQAWTVRQSGGDDQDGGDDEEEAPRVGGLSGFSKLRVKEPGTRNSDDFVVKRKKSKKADE